MANESREYLTFTRFRPGKNLTTNKQKMIRSGDLVKKIVRYSQNKQCASFRYMSR